MILELEMKKFVKMRDEAFTEFVMEDKTEKLEAYCKKYQMRIPLEKKTARAGIYKAVQECTNIPDEVKEVAKRKCIELGFYPYMEVREHDQ